MSRDPESRLGYRPELDGLRGVAILLVMSFHLAGWPRGGELGVDLFFVLSGFLITTLLLEERKAHGSISLRQFYLRRYFRLFPALAVFIACYVLFVLVFGSGNLQMRLLGAVYGLTYTSNWVMAFNLPYPEWEIAHLWTLGVEEQFYLLWPPLLVFALGRAWGMRGTRWLLVAMIATVVTWRIFLDLQGVDFSRLKFATDTRLDQLLIGCLAGTIFVTRRGKRDASPWMMLAGASGGLFLVWQVFALDFRSAWTVRFGPTLFAVAAALLVYACIVGQMSLLRRALTARWLVFIGIISYSLYLWHFAATPFVERLLDLSGWQAIVIEAMLAFIAACCSYYLIERRFLRRRRVHERLGSTKVDTEAHGVPLSPPFRAAA